MHLNRRTAPLWALTMFVLFSLLAPNLWSQATTGVITGQITDPQGAMVTTATVTATNVATNVVSEVRSDSTGSYTFPRLLPGTYKVEVVSDGFKKVVRENVIVNVGSVVRVDVALEVGSAAEAITVTAAAPLLKTERSDVSVTVEQATIQRIPLLGRNIGFLANLVPGTIPTGRGNVQLDEQALYTNGHEDNRSNQLLDGIDNKNSVWGKSMILTSAEAVQEVKITTNSYDAEYGSAGGMLTQVATKGGTNEIHGNLFHYLRNSALAARNPFDDQYNKKVAPFRYNQFGGTVGGPVIKNKLFFFGSYENWMVRNGSSALVTTPLEAWKNGDFSAFASQYPIYDPLTGNADGTGRQMFPNNVIPADRISPIARKLLGYFPAPNVNQNTFNNFMQVTSTRLNQQQYNLRGDWSINDRMQFFGRFTRNPYEEFRPRPFGDVIHPTVRNRRPADGFVANYTYSITPTLLVEARGGWNRWTYEDRSDDLDKQTSAEVGIPNVNTRPELGGLMRLQVGGPVGDFDIGHSGFGTSTWTTENYAGIGTWTKGTHTLKFGADIRNARVTGAGYNNGVYQFNSSVTGTPGVSGSGIAFASFLLGIPSSISNRSAAYQVDQQLQDRDAYFVQDSWRATSRLTINYGIRFDYFSPVYTNNVAGGSMFNLQTLKVDIANVGSVDKYANQQKDLNNWSPRIGLAYTFLPNMVIRAGFGRTYNYGGWGETIGNFTGWPANPVLSISATNQYVGIDPLSVGPPPFPGRPEIDPSGSMTPPAGMSFNTQRQKEPTAYTDSWNMAIQHEFAPNWMYEVAYVGNVGLHLPVPGNINLNGATPGPGNVADRQFYFVRYGITGEVIDKSKNDRSTYHSLQLRSEKRFAQDYLIGSTFTWAKNLQESGHWSMQDIWCRRCNKSRTGYDVKYAWRLWGSYDLPYGTGKRFGSDANPVVKHIIGGWTISGMGTWRSGWPFTPTVGNRSQLNAVGVPTFRADYVGPGDGTLENPTYKRWFNLSDYRIPAPYMLGNAGGNSLDGPGTTVVDLEVSKTWYLRESTNLKFRAAAFNAPNVANLGNPWSDIDSPMGGVITGTSGTMRRMEFGLNLTF